MPQLFCQLWNIHFTAFSRCQRTFSFRYKPKRPRPIALLWRTPLFLRPAIQSPIILLVHCFIYCALIRSLIGFVHIFATCFVKSSAWMSCYSLRVRRIETGNHVVICQYCSIRLTRMRHLEFAQFSEIKIDLDLILLADWSIFKPDQSRRRNRFWFR